MRIIETSVRPNETSLTFKTSGSVIGVGECFMSKGPMITLISKVSDSGEEKTVEIQIIKRYETFTDKGFNYIGTARGEAWNDVYHVFVGISNELESKNARS